MWVYHAHHPSKQDSANPITKALYYTVLISALASKKRSNQKNKGTLYVPLIGGFYLDSLTLLFWFDLFLDARAEILEKISLGFWKKFWHKKDILKLTDLYLCIVITINMEMECTRIVCVPNIFTSTFLLSIWLSVLFLGICPSSRLLREIFSSNLMTTFVHSFSNTA